MFHPTHVLVSRTKETPVQLVPTNQGYVLYTQQEWGMGRTPAFELRSKLGIFCLGTPVTGYHLQPIASSTVTADAVAATAH